MKINKLIIIVTIFSFFGFLNADNINYNPGQIYVGTQVNFSLQGGPPSAIHTYTWTFGDNSPPVTGQNTSVSHTYKEPGNYTVKCERPAGNSGNMVEVTVPITVDDRREVKAIGSNFTAGMEISFETDYFVESNLKWDFGDGTVNSGPKDRKHTYQNQGNYTVKVKDYNGNTQTEITCSVSVNPDSRSITFSPSPAIQGKKVAFQANDFGSNNLKWDFGDGVSNGGAAMEHTYSGSGNFTVKVTDLNIGPGSFVQISINVQPDNRTISMNPQNPGLYEEVTFTASNFGSSGIEWDFDKGEKKNNGGTVEKHTFKNLGQFTIKARESGTSNSFKSINVNVSQDKRKIEFQPSSATIGQQINIKLAGSSANTVNWKIGNDNPLNNSPREIQYKFKESGMIEVTANIQDQTPVKNSINIIDNRSLSMNPQNPGLYEEVTFTASNFPLQSLEWDFDRGDKKNNGATVEKHTFKNLGQYTVKARAAGTNNSYKSINVNIGQDKRRIEFQPPSANVGQQINIKLAGSNANTVNWKIGNDNPLNNSPGNIQYKFKDPGRFEVIANIQDQTPVKNSININDNRSVIVSSKTVFVKSDVKIDAINFNTMNLKWDFGNGVVKNGGKQQVHKYTVPGNFNIKVYDFDGQSKIAVTAGINVKRDNREIVSDYRTIFQNVDVELEGRNFLENNVSWNFGDGAVRMGGKRISHKFKRTGSFIVTAVDKGGRDTKKFTKKFVVKKDNRSISVPNQIMSGVPFDMYLKNTAGGNYEWKFSNGKKISGIAMKAGKFDSAGEKFLTIIDKSGKYPPITKKIIVVPDERSLKLSSKNVLPGDIVKVTGVNFKGAKVEWNFGDGSPSKSGGRIVSHKFNKNGTYKVVAKDFGGKGKKLFEKTVVVSDLTPGFEVQAIELKFSNGKYYRIVPKNSFSPKYLMRLKAKGRGLIKGKWLLNGDVFSLFSMSLYDNRIAVLKESDMPKLPVIDPGIHKITFEFTNYNFQGNIPILRYFVTNSGAVKILSPEDGTKIVRSKKIEVKWEKLKDQKRKFEIAISGIPFQFLKEKQISWKKVGSKNTFKIKLKGFKSGEWVYWQVRVLDISGNIDTASEIASFRIL
ncbi:MAG: PKD domain-containing protein [Acidobacteriota bacterium]